MAPDKDFPTIGKRTPFTVPEGYMQTLQQDILSKARSKQSAADKKPKLMMRFVKYGCAAAIAGLIVTAVCNRHIFGVETTLAPTLDDIGEYFAQLDIDEQEAYLDIYSDDITLETFETTAQ